MVDLVLEPLQRLAASGPVRRVRAWWTADADASDGVATGIEHGERVAVAGPPPGALDAAPGDGIDPSAWWTLLPFTTHRIDLGNGRWSAAAGVDASVDRRTRLVVDACGGVLEGRTVVDLGCLEGGFTIEFARRGAARAVGIEAREVSVRRCELARDLTGLGAAQFVQGDVKEALAAEVARQGGPFDVILATGILYHLADPAALLRSMRYACASAAIVFTHVAHPDRITHDCSSQVVTLTSGGHEYRGRWFGEYDETITDEQREGLLWAAWSDRASFWPFEDDLVRMIRDAGFESVEKIDVTAMADPWQVDHTNRVLYRCEVGRAAAAAPDAS